MASGAHWLKIRIGRQQRVSLEMGNAGTWLHRARTALWAVWVHIVYSVTHLCLKHGFGLQSAATLHELQSKLQLMFAFCLVGGSFLMLLRIICALPFFLSSFSLAVCSTVIYLQFFCFLLSFSLFSCLLLRFIRKWVHLLHLCAVSVTEAASSEESREGKCWYL